jgi:hypothetical protein
MSSMTDPGNVYSRRAEEEYLSTPVERPKGAAFARLHWKAETLPGIGVRFQVRASDTRDDLDRQPWIGPSDNDSNFSVSGTAFPTAVCEKSWLQYRVLLASPSSGNGPLLTEVGIECRSLNR